MDNGYSPWLSLGTGLFEIIAAVWILRGTGRMGTRWRVSALLTVLAGYQFAEIFICNNPSNQFLARLAFADVVWLPPIGLSLVRYWSGAKANWTRVAEGLTWAGAGALSIWMLLDTSFVVGTVCQAVLATYEHGTPFHHLFGGYYELVLCAMIFGAAVGMSKQSNAVDRAHLADLQMGVVGFVIPAMLTQIVWKGLDPSLPSIMCHYALILAILLTRAGRREQRAYASQAKTDRGNMQGLPAK